jgi:proline dehydrogenase
MLRRLLLFGSNQRWMRRLITRYRATRSFAWRFVAGESAETALEAVRELRGRGVQSTLDLLGESVTDARAAEASAEEYLALLDYIQRSGVPSHISLKLTQLGLDVDEELCRRNLRRILGRAAEYGTFVRFDMESSAYTQRTLDMYRSLRPEFSNFGVVIQSYLYRSAQDVEDLIAEGARVRLCKGAYLEPAEVAYQRKADVDASYVRLMERLLSDGNYPAIATHDPAMIAHAREYVRRRNIPNSAWEFQMLYGVRRDLQERLAAEGYNMRCYIPFGTEWYPYFMRRLAERPANLAFLLRNVLRERRRALPIPQEIGTG